MNAPWNRRLALTATVTAALCLPMLAAGPALADDIRVSGGAAPIENIFKKVKDPFEKASNHRLSLSADGPDKALAALSKGEVDIAAAGLALKDWFDLMKQRGIDVGSPSDYRHRVIGRDLIQVIAHKGLVSVKSLSKEQLRDLFTGKVNNWKEVGGPDQAVVVVLGAKMAGTNKLWQERILDGGEWSQRRNEVGDAADVKKLVAATPGAVGVGPLASEDTSVHSPASPEVGRPITAMTRGAPSAKVQALLDYVGGEGQKVVSR